MKLLPALWGFLFLLLVSTASSYTYVDLVNMLKDMERLAVLPDAGEKCAEWSSRDRAATYNSGSDQYVNWSANNDGSGFVGPNGDGGNIMAQMTGPGCIWRIWSAQANAGHVRIYIDGSAAPAVDIPFSDYFNRTQAPFTYASLVYNANGVLDNYIPIPYTTSCKVVAYNSWGAYYQVSYTTFPPGTAMPPFTLALSNAERNALASVDSFFLYNLGNDPAGARAGQIIDSAAVAVANGQTVTLADYTGQAAITGIRIRVQGLVQGLATIPSQWAVLRELAVSIQWDGETSPSVWAPLGDFFGSACGHTPFRTLAVGKQDDGWMYCYWYMPFASGARIQITNNGTASRTIDRVIVRAPLTRPIASLGRFHAKWNRNAFPVTRTDRWPDYTVLTTSGKGRFLGFMLHLYKPDDNADPNAPPGEYWWGEGDEKFFADGERSPSWFGTGSEDYFGYAWATPDYFSKPYHAQVYNEGGIHLKGNRSLNRFQISDNVPFQTSFEACIEKYYRDTYSRYDVTPYWYLAPGGTDAYGTVTLANRTGYYEAPLARDSTLIEGEDLGNDRVVSKTGGSLYPQDMAGFGSGWSNSKHLLWFSNNISGVGSGSSAVLAFPVKVSGSYSIRAVLTRAGDFGIVQFSIDNIAIGAAIDGYNNGVTRTAELTLGTRTLSAGTHQLKIAVTGKNSASSNYYSGLDYIRLQLISAAIGGSVSPIKPGNLQVSISQNGRRIQFRFSSPITAMWIYDINGRIIRSMCQTNKAVVREGKIKSGSYVVKATDGFSRTVKSFTVIE